MKLPYLDEVDMYRRAFRRLWIDIFIIVIIIVVVVVVDDVVVVVVIVLVVVGGGVVGVVDDGNICVIKCLKKMIFKFLCEAG